MESSFALSSDEVAALELTIERLGSAGGCGLLEQLRAGNGANVVLALVGATHMAGIPVPESACGHVVAMSKRLAELDRNPFWSQLPYLDLPNRPDH